MLVLGRARGQRVMIGEDMVITVLNVCGNYVKLAINQSDASNTQIVCQFLRQTIQVGKDTMLCILKIQEGLVHLGFQAPRSILIGREEVFYGKTNVNLSQQTKLAA